MKKLMIAASAALWATVGLCELASANVVGYQAIEVKRGFNMIAFNFEPVDGSEAFAVTNFISNAENLIAGTGAANSDQIQVWDGSKFDVYFYRAYKATNPNKFLLGPAWVKVGAIGSITTDTIPHGAGVWFARPSTAPETATITVSGSVGKGAFTHSIASGFNMMSSAFPADMPLNTLTAEETGAEAQTCPIDWAACGAVSGTGAANSDQIQVWDGSKFDVYFYRAYKATNPNKFLLGPAWVKVGAIGVKTADRIPAGKGFWYARPSSQAAGSLVESSPIAEQ